MDAIQMSEGRSAAFLHQSAASWLGSHWPQSPTPRILDFGAGQGLLTQTLVSQFPKAQFSAIDAMSQPDWVKERPQVQWLVQDLNQPLEGSLPANSLDILLAIEVIEHLENPRFQLKQWLKCLKPGGRLLFSTPNVESIRSLLALFFRGHFVDFLDSSYPAHITPLVSMDALRVTREAGFSDIELWYSGKGTLPVLTSLSWQALSFGLLSGKRFSDQIFVSALKSK